MKINWSLQQDPTNYSPPGGVCVMRIVTRPIVTLVWGPSFYGHPILTTPPDGDVPTKIGAFAAKTCYRSFGEEGRSNIDNQAAIIGAGHGRILEHINYGLHITGVSRALGNEFITHKAGITVSQESTRYVDMKDAGFVLEPYVASLYERDSKSLSEDEWVVLDSQLGIAYQTGVAYEQQVKHLLLKLCPASIEKEKDRRKWARGKARNSLPLGLETSFVATGNLRAWRHFIETRSERFAEAEIRRLTEKIFLTLASVAPLYFKDYHAELVDGFPEYTTANRKV